MGPCIREGVALREWARAYRAVSSGDLFFALRGAHSDGHEYLSQALDLTDLGFANRFLYADPVSAEELSAQMRSYWTNFAHTRRPGRGRDGQLPEWTPWSAARDAPKYLVFDSRNDGGLTIGSDRIDQRKVLASIQNDPRLQSAAERCRVFRNMVQWSAALSPAAYAEIDSCRPYPLEKRLYFASLPE